MSFCIQVIIHWYYLRIYCAKVALPNIILHLQTFAITNLLLLYDFSFTKFMIPIVLISNLIIYVINIIDIINCL